MGGFHPFSSRVSRTLQFWTRAVVPPRRSSGARPEVKKSYVTIPKTKREEHLAYQDVSEIPLFHLLGDDCTIVRIVLHRNPLSISLGDQKVWSAIHITGVSKRGASQTSQDVPGLNEQEPEGGYGFTPLSCRAISVNFLLVARPEIGHQLSQNGDRKPNNSSK